MLHERRVPALLVRPAPVRPGTWGREVSTVVVDEWSNYEARITAAARKEGADRERRRIRRAIAGHLNWLTDLPLSRISPDALVSVRAIDAATRTPKRKAK